MYKQAIVNHVFVSSVAKQKKTFNLEISIVALLLFIYFKHIT